METEVQTVCIQKLSGCEKKAAGDTTTKDLHLYLQQNVEPFSEVDGIEIFFYIQGGDII